MMKIKLKYIGFVFGSFVILGSSLIQTHASVWYYSPEGEPRFQTRQDYSAYYKIDDSKSSRNCCYSLFESGPPISVTTSVLAFFKPAKPITKKKRTCSIF